MHGHITEELHIRITKTDWSELEVIIPAGRKRLRGRTPVPAEAHEMEGTQEKGAEMGADDMETEFYETQGSTKPSLEEKGGSDRQLESHTSAGGRDDLNTSGRGEMAPVKYRRQPDIRDYFQTLPKPAHPKGDCERRTPPRSLTQPRKRVCGDNEPRDRRDGGFHDGLLRRGMNEEEDGDDGALDFEPDEDSQDSPAAKGS